MEWKKRNIRNVHLFCTEIDVTNLENMLDDAKIADARSILTTDFDGRIMRFSPSKGMVWGAVWYIQNLMIMQRLHQVDSAITLLKNRGVL